MHHVSLCISCSFLLALSILSACSPRAAETTSPPEDLEPRPENATPAFVPTPTLATPEEAADIIFTNGNIITIEKERPLVQAVAIKDNLILTAGSEEEALAFRGLETEVIDLQGNTLMPGFIEGHTHYTRNAWDDGTPMETMMQTLHMLGLTGITEMHSTDEYIQSMLDAESNGKITARMNIFAEYNCGFLDNGKSIECVSWYRENDPILNPNQMVRIPGVKIFADGDGTPGRGCAFKSFLWPEENIENWPEILDNCGSPYGDLYLLEEELTSVVKEIQERGYRAAFHAMGDATIETVLNAIEAALNGESNTVHRHQIEHNSVLRPDLLPRYEQLEILASVRGTFNTCDADEYRSRFGEDYYEWNANRYALAAMDIHAYSEGDFSRGDVFSITSFRPLNPIRSLYGLVTHKQLREDGSICEPPEWIARHSISVDRALEMLTLEAAYAVSMEDHTGSIKPGKFADLIILSDDPLTIPPDELGNLSVWMTMVGGQPMFCENGHENLCPRQLPVVQQETAAETPSERIQVAFNCSKNASDPQVLSPKQFIQTQIRWAASSEEQVKDFISQMQAEILIDGNSAATFAQFEPIQYLADKNAYTVLATFDVGMLPAGQHEIRTVLSFKGKINDGYDQYGPDTENPTFEGTCTVVIE